MLREQDRKVLYQKIVCHTDSVADELLVVLMLPLRLNTLLFIILSTIPSTEEAISMYCKPISGLQVTLSPKR